MTFLDSLLTLAKLYDLSTKYAHDRLWFTTGELYVALECGRQTLPWRTDTVDAAVGRMMAA